MLSSYSKIGSTPVGSEATTGGGAGSSEQAGASAPRKSAANQRARGPLLTTRRFVIIKQVMLNTMLPGVTGPSRAAHSVMHLHRSKKVSYFSSQLAKVAQRLDATCSNE